MLIVERFGDPVEKLMDVVGDAVGKIMALGLIPNCFDRIQLRRVGWKPFDREPVSSGALEVFDCRAMNSQSITDENDGAAELAMDVDNELLKLGRANVVVVNRKRQRKSLVPRAENQAGDRRQSVIAVPNRLLRRLSARCPSSAIVRLKLKAAFIRKDDDSFSSEPFFLSAAKTSSATARRLADFAHGPGVRVSGTTNRASAIFSRHGPDDSPPGIRLRSLGRCGGTSRDPNRSRNAWLPIRAIAPVEVIPPLRVEAWDRDVVWPSVPFDHSVSRGVSRAWLPPTKRRKLPRLRGKFSQLRTFAPRPCDGLPIHSNFLLVSYPFYEPNRFPVRRIFCNARLNNWGHSSD